MQLFDIVKLIFSTKEKDWKSIGSHDKARNFFMINRIMSIQFPTQANQFNKLKVVPVHVVDWWHDTLSKRFSRPPEWLYTTTKKKGSGKKETVETSETIEEFIRSKFKVSKRDLADIKNFYPKKYALWIKDISDQIGVK